MTNLQHVAENRCFDGRQLRFTHHADSVNCDMHFSVFLPPQAEFGSVPVIYWLSGLTCTDLNFVQKAGAQRYAAEHGVALVAPDTSPRGESVPGDPEGHWSFGHGAGFYVDAIRAPWREHYQMATYVAEELPRLIRQNFAVTERCALMGHSMGGHGALTLALRHPDRFSSVSAFAPICQASVSPWGVTALSRFLGDDKSEWQRYDACELMRASSAQVPMKVDQGSDDEFLELQLRPQALCDTAAQCHYPLEYQMHQGYDHSYFFIASFIEQHIAFHKPYLFES